MKRLRLYWECCWEKYSREYLLLRFWKISKTAISKSQMIHKRWLYHLSINKKAIGQTDIYPCGESNTMENIIQQCRLLERWKVTTTTPRMETIGYRRNIRIIAIFVRKMDMVIWESTKKKDVCNKVTQHNWPSKEKWNYRLPVTLAVWQQMNKRVRHTMIIRLAWQEIASVEVWEVN